MANKVEVGSFTCITSTGNQDVTLNNADLLGKFIMFWGGPDTADGFSANNYGFLGMATGTGDAQFCTGWVDDDNVATSDVNSRRDVEVGCIMTAAGNSPTINGEFKFVSFSTGSFRINFHDAVTVAYRVFYLIIGGDVLSNAIVLKKQIDANLTNEAETGAGFQPDMVIAMPTSVGSGATFPRNETTGTMHVGLGGAVSGSAYSIGFASDDGQAAENCAVGTHTGLIRIMVSQSAAVAGLDALGALVSLDADGFTISKSDAPRAQQWIWYACLKFQSGYGCTISTDTAKTGSTGTKQVTGQGGYSYGLFLYAVDNTGALMIGASDWTRHRSYWYESVDNSDSSDTNRRKLATRVISFNVSPSTAQAEATPSTRDASSFTLNWDVVTAAEAFPFGYWNFWGPAPGVGILPPHPLTPQIATHVRM